MLPNPYPERIISLSPGFLAESHPGWATDWGINPERRPRQTFARRIGSEFVCFVCFVVSVGGSAFSASRLRVFPVFLYSVVSDFGAGRVQSSAVQGSTVQSSAVQGSAVQGSAVQGSAVQSSRFKVQRFKVQRFKVQRFKVQRPPVLPSSLQVGWVLVWGARGSAPRATPG